MPTVSVRPALSPPHENNADVHADDTIAAIASAPGRAPRAVVRLSGPDTRGILDQILTPAPRGRAAFTAVFRLPALSGGGALPLPVAVLFYTAPGGYTGQDAAEILLPGNPALADRVLRAVIDAGARPADPGEFTARAYLAGKMTLDRAEAVARLIAAERDDELDAARRLLDGATGDLYRTWADRLAALLALVEAGIDFTDQDDVVPIPPPDLARDLDALACEIEAHLGGPAEAREMEGAPAVALVGPPNAGKSTLFNALLARPRAVTADLPGTTRDVLDEPLDIAGTAVRLLDLPGLDTADHADHAAREAQRHALAAIDRADVLLACDPAGRFDALDGVPADRPTIRVRTKADLHSGSPGSTDQLAVCALDGWRLDALRHTIVDAALARPGGGAVVPRHRRALAAAVRACRAAADGIDPDARTLDEPELTASALRSALDDIGSVCGRVTPDDIIGRVFATFCVGK